MVFFLQKETTNNVVLKRELENERKELSIIRDQNSKLLEQIKDGNNRELVLKQKSAALNTSNANLHKDLRDVNTFKYYYYIQINYMYLFQCLQAQRKADNECEMRRKTEALLQELKRKLDEEQNKRTKEMNNNQQHNDKINALEKQVCLLMLVVFFCLV